MTSAEVFQQIKEVLGKRFDRASTTAEPSGSNAEASNQTRAETHPQIDDNPEPHPTQVAPPAVQGDAASDNDDGDETGTNDEEHQTKQEERTTWIPAVKKVVQFKDLRNNERVVPIEVFTRQRPKLIKKDPTVATGQFQEYSTVLRKVLGADLRLQDYRLEIQSRHLCDLFRKIAKPFKELDLDATSIVIHYPFRCLFFLRRNLKELLTQPDTTDIIKQEITHLLHFIENENVLKETIKDYEELTEQRHKFREDMAWTLFQPHDMVYYNVPYSRNSRYSREGCGIIEKVEVLGKPNGGMKSGVNIAMLVGHHTGEKFGLIRRFKTLTASTTDIQDISMENLSVMPLRFLSPAEQQRIRERMLARGKKYVEYCKADFSMLQYKGPVAVESESTEKLLAEFGSDEDGFNWSWETNQRVMIDKTVQHELCPFSEAGDDRIISPSVRHFQGCAKEDENEKAARDDDEEKAMARIATSHNDMTRLLCRSSSSSTSSLGDIFRPGEVQLDDEDYIVCNADIVGFLLPNKLWAGMLVSGLKPIQWRSDPYAHLQMPEEKKSLVRSLVMGFSAEPSRQRQRHQHHDRGDIHTISTAGEDDGSGGHDGAEQGWESDSEFDDFIVGKGKGLIFLLHGEPGLGKTLTAESVAESARKPLYHVSTGDLNIDVKGLEDQLVKIFRLGLRWGAVVLLDEADVLMTRRSSAELQRNSIVAVFLRMIEYYEGMLFLTTNRVEDFDPAFYNRIHITIQYGSLGPQERCNIWRQHLSRACKGNRNHRLWNEDAYGLLGEITTNGRDIRNATRTAAGIARSRDKDLDITDVVTVMRNNFSENSHFAPDEAQDLDRVFGELMRIHGLLEGMNDATA